MNVEIKHYPVERFSPIFYKVIDFLEKYGAQGSNKNWHWARWEWLMGHPNLKMETLSQIGYFEIDGVVEGLVTHDMRQGKAYVLCNPEFSHYKKSMLDYAERYLCYNENLTIYIDDTDEYLISCAKEKGYVKTDKDEYVLSLDCTNGVLDYQIESQFSVDDYMHNRDLNKYNRVIWKGFNHEGNPPMITEADIIKRPHDNSALKVFIVAQDNEYAAHCGTWYLPDTKCAYVEPVVTIPEYREKGLGKAVVYESINRCIAMGAKQALVISNQLFYHRIGFKEYARFSCWTKDV